MDREGSGQDQNNRRQGSSARGSSSGRRSPSGQGRPAGRPSEGYRGPRDQERPYSRGGSGERPSGPSRYGSSRPSDSSDRGRYDRGSSYRGDRDRNQDGRFSSGRQSDSSSRSPRLEGREVERGTSRSDSGRFEHEVAVEDSLKSYGSLVRKSLRDQEIALEDSSQAEDPKLKSVGHALPDSKAEVWVREDTVKPNRNLRYVAPPRRSSKKLDAMYKQVESELAEAGVKRLRSLAARNMVDAIDAYEHDRYGEARTKLLNVLEVAPDFVSAIELIGLTEYRLGKWQDAIKRLEHCYQLTGSSLQDPVIADCYRALGRTEELEAVWKRLKEASPGAEVVAEGRIVYASYLAESGQAAQAIALLETALGHDRRPRLHDLRQIYVLAGLYESAGNVALARETFKLLMDFDATLYDVAERLADLS